MNTPTEILDACERLGWKNNDPMAQTLQLRRWPICAACRVSGHLWQCT